MLQGQGDALAAAGSAPATEVDDDEIRSTGPGRASPEYGRIVISGCQAELAVAVFVAGCWKTQTVMPVEPHLEDCQRSIRSKKDNIHSATTYLQIYPMI